MSLEPAGIFTLETAMTNAYEELSISAYSASLLCLVLVEPSDDDSEPAVGGGARRMNLRMLGFRWLMGYVAGAGGFWLGSSA